MKILMLISSLEVGGAETHLCDLAVGLARLDVGVTVASGGGVLEAELRGAGIGHIRLPLASKDPISVARSYLALRNFV